MRRVINTGRVSCTESPRKIVCSDWPVQSKGPTIIISSSTNTLCITKIIWALAVAYGLVGLGLFYSLAVDSSELILLMTTIIYVLMLPLAYSV